MHSGGPKSSKRVPNHTSWNPAGEAKIYYENWYAAVDYCGYTMFYLGGLYGFERYFLASEKKTFLREIWSLRDAQTLPIFF